MSKVTVFEGEVNGQKYNNVVDYNKAMEAALTKGGPISASSKTEVKESEDSPKSGAKKSTNEILDSYLELTETKLNEQMTQLKEVFKNMSEEAAKDALYAIHDLHVLANRKMEDLDDLYEVHQTKQDDLDNQITELQKKIDKLEEEFDDIDDKLSDVEIKHDKLETISDTTQEILEKNKSDEPMTTPDLWQMLVDIVNGAKK